MASEIRKVRQRIRARINRAQKDLKELQKNCPHEGAVKRWAKWEFRFTCPECDKEWSVC